MVSYFERSLDNKTVKPVRLEANLFNILQVGVCREWPGIANGNR